jgi:putative ABC transport system permease protein
MVSARMAESIAPDGSPLGKLLEVNDGTPTPRQLEVVGVVADNRTRPMQIGTRPAPVIYVPFRAASTSSFTLHVRANNFETVSTALRSVARDVEPRLPWLSLRRAEEIYAQDAGGVGIMAMSLGGLGMIGLLLSAAGLYAVMAYLVLLRHHEIGVRLAVGADPRNIITMVMKQAFSLVLIGAVIGLSLAILLAFALRPVFVGTVTPLDPVALGPPVVLLTLSALLAAILPARRASKVDPIETLRHD